MNDQSSDFDLIVGKNAVLAFLERQSKSASPETGRKAVTLHKIFLAEGLRPDARIDEIKRLAREERVQVVTVDRRKLDRMVSGMAGAENHHQGIIAQLSQVAPLQLSEFLGELKGAKGEAQVNPLVVIVDQIEDPHNLGAIMRVAEAAGAKAILLPVRRSAGVTWAVAKSSAGASALLPVVSIQNVVHAIEKLKEAGFWIAGLSLDATQTHFEADLKRPLAVVIGNEGHGLTRLVCQNCDMLLRIPMLGQTESLNASVAAGIVLFEFVRQNYPPPSRSR
jgi:23S rRNA (guanosine2251-2'-O)-methyltransferase